MNLDRQLDSDDFLWNSELKYDADILDQSLYLSSQLLFKKEPLEEWKKLYSKYKYYHEGWRYSKSNYNQKMNKECYIFLAGIGMAFLLFKKGDIESALGKLDLVTSQLISQYRISQLSSPDYYNIPLKFLTHTLFRYDRVRLKNCLSNIVAKIDGLESVLDTIDNIFIQMKDDNVDTHDILPIKKLNSRIDNEFWIIEKRYKALGTHFTPKLRYFQSIRDKIKN